MDCRQLADVIKGGITDASPQNTIATMFNICVAVATDLKVQWFIDSGVSNAQAANIIRGSILIHIERGIEVAAIGAARGYLLPSSPIPRFVEINRTRQLFAELVGVTQVERDRLVETVRDLVAVGHGYDAGTITFDRSSAAAQLSSFEISVDGMSKQSGDPLVDILGYQPDGDFVKRRRALDSLSKLDFSKRKPYLLFTADVITGGRRENGTIVCWGKMRDAAGYNITKRDVFRIIDYPPINLSNEFLQQSTAELLGDPDFMQVLSFYDWVRPDDIVAFVDDANQSDTLYSYVIAGVQRRRPASTSIFDVAMNSLYLSPAQVEAVRTAITSELTDPKGGIDSVSPYPALAKVVYGDPGYGWILAGCNVLASRRRGDSIDQVRSFSYIGSHATDMLAAASSGRLSVPADVDQIHRSVDDSIASYGVSQMILGVLDGVGLTMFATGKDDPLGIQLTQESLENATGGLAKILGAIDPRSATLDPKTLSAALVNAGTATVGMSYSTRQLPSTLVSATSPFSLDKALGEGVLDLTTYEGLARLMQIIRTVYDFYPGALS